MFKTKLVGAIIVLILLLLGGFIYWQQSQIYVVNGNLKEVRGQSIIVTGEFKTDAKKQREPRQIEIAVDPETLIVKRAFSIPPGGKMFVVADLPKEESTVDLTIMRNDMEVTTIGLEAVVKRNLLGKLIAKEIIYLIPKF